MSNLFHPRIVWDGIFMLTLRILLCGWVLVFLVWSHVYIHYPCVVVLYFHKLRKSLFCPSNAVWICLQSDGSNNSIKNRLAYFYRWVELLCFLLLALWWLWDMRIQAWHVSRLYAALSTWAMISQCYHAISLPAPSTYIILDPIACWHSLCFFLFFFFGLRVCFFRCFSTLKPKLCT